MKLTGIFFGLLLWAIGAQGQIIRGTSGYVEYRPGTLPVVISAPHGGSLTPASIPDRTCNEPTTATDLNTIELALQIDSAFFKATGCHANIVLCRLKRTKIDCNREIAEGACGNAEAETAWKEYHAFIDSALASSRIRHGAAFYIDLHGHGHAVPRLELGYGLSATLLRAGNSTLNSPGNVALSSIGLLAGNNLGGLSHADLIRGASAFGTLLANKGYPSVPSSQDPAPDPDEEYYNGGYSTVIHTCITRGVPYFGVQIECNRVGVRDTWINRHNFADTVSSVIGDYLMRHLGINIMNCTSGAEESIEKPDAVSVFPTQCAPGQILTVSGLTTPGVMWQLLDMTGRIHRTTRMDPTGRITIPAGITDGMYILVLRDDIQVVKSRIMICSYGR